MSLSASLPSSLPQMPASVNEAARSAQHHGGRAAQTLGRIGYAARSVVYATIGVLALRAAAGLDGGDTVDSKQAIRDLASGRFGTVVLVVLGLAMAGFALWRVVEALGRRQDGGPKPFERLVSLFSAVVYAGLVVQCWRLLNGARGGGGDKETHDWTGRLMGHEFGVVVVGIVGVIFLIFAIAQVRKGVTDRFLKRIDMACLSAKAQALTLWSGRAGYVARGIVFGIVGAFLIVAAVKSDPRQARGLGGALDALFAQPFGPLLLGAVAIGLIAFGTFSALSARSRVMG